MSLLEVRDLEVHYHADGGTMNRAVAEASFSVEAGETLAIVGESGCGKSSMANAITRSLRPAGGQIVFEGRDVTHLRGKALLRARDGMQIVFQNPLDALDPRFTVATSIEEPLRLRGMAAPERRQRVAELIEGVELSSEHLERYPHQLSGGQQQRVVIARAFACHPRLVVLDEPTSSLDFMVRDSVVELLARIQQDTNCAYVFISHDIRTVTQIASRVAVMYLGRIVEIGPAERVLNAPRHPYTRALLDAVPVPDPALRRQRVALAPEALGVAVDEGACAFAPRCPLATGACSIRPPLASYSGRDVACHHADAVQDPAVESLGRAS
jgi:oligopeptide/dipeptide ABC transporter ATP-binding protein